MRNLINICFFFALSTSLGAQNLTGTITNEKGEFLYGATILWEGTDIGTVADENGFFELIKKDTIAFLRIEYVGYDAVVLEVLPSENELQIAVEGITELMEVEVAAKRKDSYVSTISTLNIETLGSGEFRKAPCCSLAESFSTNASIDVAYTDAVTGTREIRMLGLRGTYTQLLVEKRPIVSGLGSAFIMEYIPGTWLNSIQISKGTSTVQNGYQAITGQINSELVKPFQDKRFFINLYGSTFGRGEANIHLNHQISDKWSTGLLLHGGTRKNEMDDNEDTFYDTPQKTMVDVLWRTFYRGDVLRGQINAHVISDRHQAGQIPNEELLTPYEVKQNNDRYELFGKIGYLGFKNETQSIGLIADVAYHELDSYYGNLNHQGVQRNAYINGMFSTGLDSVGTHKLDLGVSYTYDDYNEQLDQLDISRTEKVVGAFAEYSFVSRVRSCEDDPYTFANKFGLVVGARLDHHNISGVLFTPRANVKYNFSEDQVVRLSVGRGYRMANVIAENVGVLASSRAIVLLDQLDIEEAWNFGFNFTQNFKIGEREGSFSADIYRTNFVNQVVMDLNSNVEQIQFYNLNGESYANSFLGVASMEVLKGLELKVAYKFNDVKVTFLDGELRRKPMNARHRGLITLDYSTPNEKWEFNVGNQFVGKQRFVDLIGNPQHNFNHHIGDTPSYMIMNTQVTYKISKQLELYGGCENLTNYIQEDPIIDWQNPFGNNFDTSHVYAPITGAMGYIGLRFGIE
jgi:outer membrane receptor for ferrienterochelin and colicins